SIKRFFARWSGIRLNRFVFRLGVWLSVWAHLLTFAFLAHQVVVIEELVAVTDKEIRTRALDAYADDCLVVFAQFAHQRRKVGITAKNRKGIQMLFRIAKVQGVDDHPN